MAKDTLLLAIRHQMQQDEISLLELAHLLKGRVSQATVYNYVKNGNPAMSDTVEEILIVLGLVVAATKGTSHARSNRKRSRVKA